MNTPTTVAPRGTKITGCTCKSGYQDDKYGGGNRVHNQAKSNVQGKANWRCTVCGKTKES